jgi:hypothetical protein
MNTLNTIYSPVSARRRYESWFVRLGLADGSGAWWFRYLLTNPGRQGCPEHARGGPVQVWATWFPRGGQPQSFIQGFPLDAFERSGKDQSPFHFGIHENSMQEESCRGHLLVDGHEITWDLKYHSSFHCTLSSKGWIGFSRTPHSDAVFHGSIILDDRKFDSRPLGFGLQGHNCGYRHRNMWTWAHAYFPGETTPSTFEALTYEMPLGVIFRKALLWHEGRAHIFSKWREVQEDRQKLLWAFRGSSRDGRAIQVDLDGGGDSLHRLSYVKTNCSGDFEVANNSLANATLLLEDPGHPPTKLQTAGGAVVEAGGCLE